MTGTTAPPDAVLVAVVLLRMVGGSGSDASHLAAAISRHRREMRLEGSAVPASLAELEKVFARIAIGPRRSTEVQAGSEIGDSTSQRDGGLQQEPPHQLLTRAQAARRLRCSISTLKRRDQAGDLRSVRHGRTVRYRVSDIDDYVNRSKGC